MYRGPSQYFKVVHFQEKQFTVWHAEAYPLEGWRETGCYGSENECWDYVEESEVEQGFILRFYNGN